jgi:hypothetical protein
MSDHRQRIDPVTAEQLIRGARAGSAVGSSRLADLLAASAAPARRGELTGEEAAVMAFRDAHLAIAPESRRRSMLKSALAKMATAKAAIVLAAVGGGGVALAAGSGHMPGVGASDDHSTGRPSASVTASEHAMASAVEHGSSAAAAHDSATPHASAKHGSAAPHGSPSPNLRGLCTAFNAGAGDNPGKALGNPAFTVLINTAGGRDKVAGYCTALLATPAGKSSTLPNDPSRGASSTHSASHPSGPDQTPSHPEPTPSHPEPTPPTTPSH